MRKAAGILLLMGLAVTPVLAQKVTIDYAHDFDFSTLKTFAYHQTDETNSPDPLMDKRTHDAIVGALTAGGLEEVESDPDMYVTYHTTSKDDTVLTTTGYGYGGWGAGWGGWGGGMNTSTTTASTYVEGTLIIDAYEATDKKLIWRGTGTVTLKQSPEKRTQQIDAIISKMETKWHKILKNKGE